MPWNHAYLILTFISNNNQNGAVILVNSILEHNLDSIIKFLQLPHQNLKNVSTSKDEDTSTFRQVWTDSNNGWIKLNG